MLKNKDGKHFLRITPIGEIILQAFELIKTINVEAARTLLTQPFGKKYGFKILNIENNDSFFLFLVFGPV